VNPSRLGALAAVLLMAGALGGCGRKSGGHMAYATNCGICHHGGGGMVGETPALTGRLDIIAKTPAGRHYLASVLLNGLGGPITAGGDHFNGMMPSFRRLDDAQIAAILTFLSSRGETRPAPVFDAREIAALRLPERSPGDVAEERARLDSRTPLP